MVCLLSALALLTFVSCSSNPSGEDAGTTGGLSAPPASEAPESPTSGIPDGFYIGTVSREDAEAIAPDDVVAEFFPEGTKTRDFGLFLDAGTWRESDVEDGQEIGIGDLGTFTVEADTISFTSENVPQILTFTWTFGDGTLTLEPESTTGNGPLDGWFPDELLVMAHDWELQD